MLLLAIVGFLIFNSITTFSTHFVLTLVARFSPAQRRDSSLLAGYARRMVPVHQQGKALAVAMVGTRLRWRWAFRRHRLGTAVGWRTAFGIMSALTLLLIGWVLLRVPDYPGQSSDQRLPLRTVFMTPRASGAGRGAGVDDGAQHSLPHRAVRYPAGLAGQVDSVLLVFGIAALAAIGRPVASSITTCASPCSAVWRCLRWSRCCSSGWRACRCWFMSAWRCGADVWRGGHAAANGAGGCGRRGRGCGAVDERGGVEQRDCRRRSGRWRVAYPLGRGVFPLALLLLLAIGFLIALQARQHGFQAGARHQRVQGH